MELNSNRLFDVDDLRPDSPMILNSKYGGSLESDPFITYGYKRQTKHFIKGSKKNPIFSPNKGTNVSG